MKEISKNNQSSEIASMFEIFLMYIQENFDNKTISLILCKLFGRNESTKANT